MAPLFIHKFKVLKNPSNWRRISIANWRAPNDPTVYGFLDIDFTPVLAFLDKINAQQSERISPTHIVAKALALVLKKFPDLNGIIRWQKIYLRQSIDIFLQVAIEAKSNQPHSGVEGEALEALPLEGATRAPINTAIEASDANSKPDLSGAKIENCDQKSLEQIACELRGKCSRIRQNDDPQFKKTFSLLSKIPAYILSLIVKIGSFFTYNFDLNLPQLGFPADPFGSAMVTSVGMFKMPPGLAPLVPASRVPLIVCLGEVRDKPWVVNNQIVIRPIAQLGITFDHRFIDGLTGSKMAKYMESILANPEEFL